MTYIPDMTERYPEGIPHGFGNSSYDEELDSFVEKHATPEIEKRFSGYVQAGIIKAFDNIRVLTDIYISEAIISITIDETQSISDVLDAMQITLSSDVELDGPHRYQIRYYI